MLLVSALHLRRDSPREYAVKFHVGFLYCDTSELTKVGPRHKLFITHPSEFLGWELWSVKAGRGSVGQFVKRPLFYTSNSNWERGGDLDILIKSGVRGALFLPSCYDGEAISLPAAESCTRSPRSSTGCSTRSIGVNSKPPWATKFQKWKQK